MTIHRYRHDHQTGMEFHHAMAGIKMSEAEFCRLTGVRERTLDKWIADGPPYWASMFLAVMADGPARKIAHAKAEQDLMTETEYQALGEQA